MYEYKATPLKVIDGDTIDLLIDLGFSVHVKERVRLWGIDTPETRTRDKKEKKAGLAAKKYVLDWIAKHPSFTIRTHKDGRGKFGRMLAEIFEDGKTLSLNDDMVALGYAKPYFGGKK